MKNSDKSTKMQFLEFVKRFGRRKPKTQNEVVRDLTKRVQKVVVDDEYYIMKRSDLVHGIAGIASSKMYNAIGIHTPQNQLMHSENYHVVLSMQEDVTMIDGLDVLLANDNLDYLEIEKSLFDKDKWQVFYDEDLLYAFLQFMTPECLEQLTNLYLVDELRTDRDRWLQNFYLYKLPDSKKYEGVIAIDLEEMAIFQYCGVKKDDFENFISTNYCTSSPQQTIDYACYKSRILELMNLIYDGVLSPSNIQTIKNALKFNFPNEFEKLCRLQKVPLKRKNEIVEPIKRLWDYNNSTLEKDFGL